VIWPEPALAGGGRLYATCGHRRAVSASGAVSGKNELYLACSLTKNESKLGIQIISVGPFLWIIVLAVVGDIRGFFAVEVGLTRFFIKAEV
jgi:hypothetical protein